jgi:hypothetical protein
LANLVSSDPAARPISSRLSIIYGLYRSTQYFTITFDQQHLQNKMADTLGFLNACFFISTQAGDNFLNLHQLVQLAAWNWIRKSNLLTLWTRKTEDQFKAVFPSRDYTNRNLWREYLPGVLSIIEKEEFRDQKEQYEELLMRVGIYLYRDGRHGGLGY